MITKRATQNRIEIHIGDNTHNHDHVATAVVPVNFNTINTIVSNPTKPMPDDEDDELFPIILFVYMFLQFVDFQLLQFFHQNSLREHYILFLLVIQHKRK